MQALRIVLLIAAASLAAACATSVEVATPAPVPAIQTPPVPVIPTPRVPAIPTPTVEAKVQPSPTPAPSPTPPPSLAPAVTPSPQPTVAGVPLTPPTPRGATAFDTPKQRTGVVTGVVDGDTFDVVFDDGFDDRVGLLGVDVPEIRLPNSPNEYATITDTFCLDTWGTAAAQFVNQAIWGTRVSLVFDPAAEERDLFGRLLAYVQLEGNDLGAALVLLGVARVDTEAGGSRLEQYLSMEEQARAQKVGPWECG